MTLSFVLNVLVMASFGFVLYIFARALPRVNDEDASPQQDPISFHWITMYFEEIDEWMLAVFEKWLRKTRLILLKLDNSITSKLHRFQKGTVKENGFSIGESKEEEKEEEIK